jgi:membrane-bound serine protease (ClpP class)
VLDNPFVMTRSTGTTLPADKLSAFALIALCLVGIHFVQAQPPAEEFARPVLIRVEGPITPLLEQFLYRKLDHAQEQQADLIILEIDSPGGFVTTTLNMADRLRGIKSARTVAFIPREAISGAAIISLACDDIVMSPHARLGDAGQIMLAADNAFRYVPEKERSVLARHLRDLAMAKGRSPALAEAMVDMDLIVYEVKNIETGDLRFLSEAEIRSLDDPRKWEKVKLVHESREKHFLTVNGDQAVELQLAAGTAETREEVMARYNLGNNVLVLEQTMMDTVVTVLNWRIVTGLLFVVGLIALYIELSAPGIGIGGLISCLCFALFFWSRFLGGTAGWLEVILFVTGIAFIAVELFVIPGFGIAGVSGLLLMVTSVVMASQHFVVPSTDLERSTFLGSLIVVAGSGIVFLAAALALSPYLGSVPIISWLVLDPSSNSPIGMHQDGDKDMKSDGMNRFALQTGDTGVAESPLRPAGRARFGDDSVDVVSNGTFVEAGRIVRVVDISGNRVVVQEIL